MQSDSKLAQIAKRAKLKSKHKFVLHRGIFHSQYKLNKRAKTPKIQRKPNPKVINVKLLNK